MSTHIVSTKLTRAVIAAVCAISAASCGGDMLRTGRAPVYLVVTSVAAGAEGAELTDILFSDVRGADNVGVFNDNVQITLRVEQKNPTAEAVALNAVTMTRYRVNFRRADGRNTPGVDVPFGFDGALSRSIQAGAEGTVAFVIVRHSMKLEPPLSNLTALSASGQRVVGGLGFLSTVADITLWGRDQNGNEVTTTASLDVHFGNFSNP